ncbi:MAG: RHS repeat domain-containing protein [Sulfuricellaceae bacterium]
MHKINIGGNSKGWKRIRLALAWCLLGLFGASQLVYSSQYRYDYDALGRLVRSIGAQGQATEYSYDSVGNLLQVISGMGTATAPTITSITPASFMQGQVTQVTIVGAGLTGVAVTPSIAGLSLSNVLAVPTQITFHLTVAQDAAPGQQGFMIASAAGVVTANINVVAAPPQISVEPMPLAIPPDNVGRNFTIRLSKPDVVDNVIALTASNQNISVSPGTVTIRAGDTAATATVKGVSAGLATINLSSSSLGNSAIPVYITAEFVGISTGYASPLGVLLSSRPSNGVGVPQTARGVLGVTVGRYLGSLSPQTVSVGADASLTLTGAGLDAVGGIAVLPPDGLTLGAPQPAPDGKSLALPIAVAANAPTILRRLVVKDAVGNTFNPAVPNADRLLVTLPAPEIQSVDPLIGVVGTSFPFTVRGRNLAGVQSISFVPEQGITAGVSPTMNADGAALTTMITVAPNALLGQHTVVANAAGGSSGSITGPANTFTVTLQSGQTFAPVASSLLGVSLATSVAPISVPVLATSPSVGVTLGKAVSGMNPKVGIIGSSITLTLQGSDLNGASSVQFAPTTGITAGTPRVAADGKSLTVDLTIAVDAPQTLRAITVWADGARVPAAQGGDRFFVSAPLPVIEGISPIMVQIGQAPVTLTVGGVNLQNSGSIDIVPGSGITVSSPPVVNALGTLATVSLSASVSAATGPRLVTITTPSGQSGGEPLPSNTLTLVSDAPLWLSPLLSAPLGVSIAIPPSSLSLPVYGAPLGMLLQKDAAPTNTSATANATTVGVALGSIALDRTPAALLRGASAILTVTGVGLDKAGAIRLHPAEGISLGTASIAPDGDSITVPLAIAADAAIGKRKIIVDAPAGKTIDFADAAVGILQIGAGVPQLDSITPILAKQGDRITLIVRGRNFNDVQTVVFTPPDGIIVSDMPVVDATGTQITVDAQVLDGASLGSRVLQVGVPGGISSDVSVPANTFTVYGK